MFEYILAGFTGSFFSYFCIYWAGLETHAFAVGTSSDKVIRVMNMHNEEVERNLDRILRQINNMPNSYSTSLGRRDM